MEPIVHGPKLVTENASHCLQFAVWRGMLEWMCAACGMAWHVGVDVHVSEREGEQCCNVVGLSPGPCSLPPLSTPFSC